jgi:hypothetical protein
MKKIFEFCEKWETCENEDLQNLFEESMIKGKGFKWPADEKLTQFNDICSSCKQPLLIEEKKCPVCENESLGPPKLIISTQAASRKLYNYRCEPCDRVLYSHKKFIL